MYMSPQTLAWYIPMLLLILAIIYWVVRLAVRHGIRDNRKS